MGRGNHFESFAGVVEVATSTIYQWTYDYPEFSEAAHIGRAKCLLFWDNLGVRAAQGQVEGFPQAHYQLQMKNRFGWGGFEYQERLQAAGLLPKEREVTPEVEVNLDDRARQLEGALRQRRERAKGVLSPDSLRPESDTKVERLANELGPVPVVKRSP